MLRSYLRIALRNLVKNRTYSLINICGLAVGVACCLLISLYVRHELSYDTFHAQHDNIFRVSIELGINDVVFKEASIPFPSAQALRSEFPQITEAARVFKNTRKPLIEYGEQKFLEERFLFADPSFLNVFDFKLVSGDAKAVLQLPNSVMISESTSRKYFGSEPALGKTLEYNATELLTVTAVFEDVPATSHMKFDFLTPLEFQMNLWKRQTGLNGREYDWFWTAAWTYLKLDHPRSSDNVAMGLPGFVNKHFPDRTKAGIKLALQPLGDIHLYSNLDNEIEPNSDILYVFIFTTIVFFVLLIACINFINLTTVQLITRTKEVGIRKVMGAHKRQIVGQLVGETLITGTLAIVIAVGLVELCLPFFENLIQRDLQFTLVESFVNMITLAGLALFIGMVSGLYPALYITKHHSATILRKEVTQSPQGQVFLKGLVVLQFAVSISLMIGVSVIHQQMRYIGDKGLGYDKDNLLFIKARPEVNVKFDTFRAELLKNPQIRNVSATSNIPGEGAFGYRFVPEGYSLDKPLLLPMLIVDHAYFSTLGIQFSAGRAFKPNAPDDLGSGFILNQAAVETLGWSSPVGKQFALFGAGTNEIAKSGQVIGVVKNYNYESLFHHVKPLVLTYDPAYSYYVVKLNAADLPATLDHIRHTWNTFSSKWPLEYTFQDNALETLYANEGRLSEIIKWFAVIALTIACLGLLGLAGFSVQKRTKEIGIRKVMGATITQLINLLSMDFVKLLLIASGLAIPLSYFGMDQWLDNFVFRTELDWRVFVLSGLTAILIAYLTTAFRALRIAKANPVTSLRHE